MKSKRQPLSYQLHNTSCWVTSMMNGLLVLHRDKNEMPTLAYRLLHTVLTDEGVISTGSAKNEWKVVLGAVSEITGLRIRNYLGPQVESALNELDFKNQVAVCDTEKGHHSVLLTGIKNGWVKGFDPDWDNIKDGECIAGKYETCPASTTEDQSRFNFRVNASHFACVTKGMPTKLRMGAVPSRILTVIDRR